jgi:hypothetical protein
VAAVASFGIVWSTPAPAAQIGIGFNEITGSGPDTLSVFNFPTAIIGGTTDNWTITLPGITLSSLDLPQVWIEKPGDTGFNVLSIIGPNELSLVSETTNPGTNDNFCGTGSPLNPGVTCFIGSDGLGNDYFASISEITTPLPAALPLFATGLGGLGLLGWRRKRKAQAAA